MNIALLAVGRLRPYYRAASDDYLRRLSRYARVSECEVRETTSGSPAVGQRTDAAALLAKAPDRATLVALARDGGPWSSQDLARRVERWRTSGRPVALVIGGSWGLGPAVLDVADATWSLGPLTLPHELARVVVLEQLYRAFTMLEGHPYHKGAGSR
jgi:23S rRNA (pseudouridine1915-N3)-methyltransferase